MESSFGCPQTQNFFEKFLNNALASSSNWETFKDIFLKTARNVSEERKKNINMLYSNFWLSEKQTNTWYRSINALCFLGWKILKSLLCIRKELEKSKAVDLWICYILNDANSFCNTLEGTKKKENILTGFSITQYKLCWSRLTNKTNSSQNTKETAAAWTLVLPCQYLHRLWVTHRAFILWIVSSTLNRTLKLSKVFLQIISFELNVKRTYTCSKSYATFKSSRRETYTGHLPPCF